MVCQHTTIEAPYVQFGQFGPSIVLSVPRPLVILGLAKKAAVFSWTLRCQLLYSNITLGGAGASFLELMLAAVFFRRPRIRVSVKHIFLCSCYFDASLHV